MIHILIILSLMRAPLPGVPLLFFPVHVLLFTLIVGSLRAVLFDRHPCEEDAVTWSPGSRLFDGDRIKKICLQDIPVFLAILGVSLVQPAIEVDSQLARTFFLVGFMLLISRLVYSNRSEQRTIWYIRLTGEDRIGTDWMAWIGNIRAFINLFNEVSTLGFFAIAHQYIKIDSSVVFACTDIGFYWRMGSA